MLTRLDANEGQVTPIDVLSDDVLLEIFHFYAVRILNRIEAWQTLVHVCRRWRCLVFGSPRRLNLRLFCTPKKPARERLDVWPALPLFVQGDISLTSVDNIVAALGHRDRVDEIDLRGVTRGFQWDEVLAAMQVPFPALTGLRILCQNGRGLAIPDTFLSGSASRLRYLDMDYIPFPGIQNLLLSATHLTNLELSDIPCSGYTSPKAMATYLSMLTSLDTLSLDTLSSRPCRHPLPMTRFILPNLKSFWFKGASEYLEGLVSWIDAPRLYYLDIMFFHKREINPDTPHLVQFISRTPGFEEPNEAYIRLDLCAEVQLRCASDNYGRLRVEIFYYDVHPLVSSIAHICAMCFPHLPTVEKLRIGMSPQRQSKLEYLWWKDHVENSQWLELLRPFTAVKSLYLPEEFQPDMASALQELVGDRTMEVLPSLQNIFLARFEPSGSFQEAIGPFVAAREVSGHPIEFLSLYADN